MQAEVGLVVPWALTDLLQGPVLVKANLGVLLGPFHTHPGPAEAATIDGSLCSSKQVAQDQ